MYVHKPRLRLKTRQLSPAARLQLEKSKGKEREAALRYTATVPTPNFLDSRAFKSDRAASKRPVPLLPVQTSGRVLERSLYLYPTPVAALPGDVRPGGRAAASRRRLPPWANFKASPIWCHLLGHERTAARRRE